MDIKMDIQKWNYDTEKYEDYQPKANWKIKLYSDDMSEVINCASCGKAITFGSGYTSKIIHNSFGMGYTICSNCYDKEYEKYMEKNLNKSEE